MKPNIDKRVRLAVIGAGNRANKYMEYVRMNPDMASLVAIVDPQRIRRDSMADMFNINHNACFETWDGFFASNIKVDAVLIATSENAHFIPCMKAIEKGYDVLLEKPIAQTMQECREIAERAKEKNIIVESCHVLRYHPYFKKIKELVDCKEVGEIVSITHYCDINLDRFTHGFVRGNWNSEERSNPTLLAKACHDMDFLLWLCGKPCKRVSSFGSLRWFRKENASLGSAERCIDCGIEKECPYSAVDLYTRRRLWIDNFDIPKGKSIDDVIRQELQSGRYGRCVYRCDNDVVDHQTVSMELTDGTTISFSLNAFTKHDNRSTHIRLTNGEIDGNEKCLTVHNFTTDRIETFDFTEIENQPFHAGADIKIMEKFISAVAKKRLDNDSVNDNVALHEGLCTSISSLLDSYQASFAAEMSRKTGKTVNIATDMCNVLF